MMYKSTLLAVALLALEANAFWRLPCRQRLSLERIDPIDTPGKLAKHVHTVHGANAFRKDSTNDDLRASDCSSCSVKEDMSAYWTPNLYWESPNGDLVALNQTGGMLVYYLQRGENVQPFPKDLRMIAGDGRLRSFSSGDPTIEKSLWGTLGLSTNQAFLRQKAVGFNCLNYGAPANAALGIHNIPQGRSCPDGLRAEVFFPSCWNGKDSDSKDHKSHMAYPSTMDNGDCPEGFPIRVPSLFFETIWNVGAVAGMGGRLVFSNGDATGYGNHGDFMNGWQQDVLERAIKTCTDPSGIVEQCPEFTFYTPEEYSKCTKPEEVAEEVWGPMKLLPGCNKVTDGPDYAPGPNCDGAAQPEYATSKSKTSTKATSTREPSSTTTANYGGSDKEAGSGNDAEILSVGGHSKSVNGSDGGYTGNSGKKDSGKSSSSNDNYDSASSSSSSNDEDPYVVTVTITEYVTAPAPATTTVKSGYAVETVVAPPSVKSVYVRRHLHEHHQRRHH